MESSWQSRLGARLNVQSQKLVDNAIRLGGVLTDVIIIRQKLNNMLDVESLDIKEIDHCNMVFPKLEDIPLYRFINSTFSNDVASSMIKEEEEPIVVRAPIGLKIDQGSLIVRVFEYATSETRNLPITTEPWILVLKVADVLGTVGARSFVWQKLNLTYPDDVTLTPEIKSYINKIVARRNALKW